MAVQNFNFFPESSNIKPQLDEGLDILDSYGDVIDEQEVSSQSTMNTLFGLGDMLTSRSGVTRTNQELIQKLELIRNELAVGINLTALDTPAFKQLLNQLRVAQGNLPTQQNINQTKEFRKLLSKLAVHAAEDIKRAAKLQPHKFTIMPYKGFPLKPIGRFPKPVKVILPVPPEKWEVNKVNDARTYVALNQEEFSLPGYASLESVRLEGLFPYLLGGSGKNFKRPSYVPNYINGGNYFTPNQLVTFFKQMMNTSTPFNLSIMKGGTKGKGGPPPFPKIATYTITDFTFSEAFGAPGDISFQMTLRQFRAYRVLSKGSKSQAKSRVADTSSLVTTDPQIARQNALGIETPPPIPKMRVNPGSRPIPSTYIVREGETLWDISARYLGSGTRWVDIYELNQQKIKAEARRRGESLYPANWRIWPSISLKMPES